MARPYDVVVWGATGFTGKLVCEYLGKQYTANPQAPKVKWAMAGRSQERIEKVRAELAAIVPEVKDIPILAADPSDEKALDEVIGKGKVVLAMAGPYLKYGIPVVDSAVRCKTHYADITGESPFMRRSIDLHHSKASADGARPRTCIVHAVGYDCIPWDLGTLLCAKFAKEKLGRMIARVDGFVGASKGGFSGGTIASGANLLENPQLVGNQNAHCLDPEFPEKEDSMGLQLGPAFSEAGQRWTMASIMATVNSKVVYRTAGLMPELFGPRGKFHYHESTLVPNWLAAAIGTAVLGSFFGLFSVSPVRWLMFKAKLLPSPGEGPARDVRESGCFKAHFVGTTVPGEGGEPPKRVYTELHARNQDPGYKGTALMAAEAALCLALDTDKLVKKGGALTPASCMGNALAERLRRAEGWSIDVRELAADEKNPLEKA